MHLKIENAEKLSFPDKYFDAVLSVNLFHHLEKPFIVLDEMIRVVKDKGKVGLSDFTEKGMCIINKCHDLENRHHDHFKTQLNEAKRYFLDKNLRIEEYDSGIQKMIIAFK